MRELRDRFESLSRVRGPDLWLEIEGREPDRVVEPSSARRVLVALVAFVVSIAGVGFAAISFGGSERPSTSAAGPVGVANGPIYFRVGGGDGGSHIETVEPDGSGQRVVAEGEPMRIAQIAWSPDGTKMAFQNPIADERGIFVANPDGSDAVRLTEGANDAWPSWSPDGTRIVFASTRYDPSIEPCEPAGADATCPTDLYTIDIDGSNITRLTSAPAAEYRARWSPTGDLIAFERNTEDPPLMRPAIFTLNLDGTEVRKVSTGDGGSDFWPSWSPDGTRIVFAAIRNEDWGIWSVNADGANEHMILGGTGAGYVDNPVWSPDGTLIAVVGNLAIDDYSPDDALYVMRPDGSDVTPIADAPSVGVAGDIAWQPVLISGDGEEPPFALTRGQVVGTFPVGRDVRSVAYGEGDVWVAVSESGRSSSGRIVRIDPVTHDVQAEIPVGSVPTWEVGGGAMVFAEGDLWVAGALEKLGGTDSPGAGADAAIVRIDPSTNEVVQEYAMGGTGAADLTFLDGDLWVLVFGDETVDHGMEVVRVDLETGDVLARVPLDSSWAHSIVAADGRLVVLEGGNDSVNVDGRAAVIDPSTNSVSRVELPSRSFTPMPVVWRGQVWILVEPGFVRLDPTAARSPEPVVPVPPRVSDCCGFLEADDRGIWWLSLAPNGSDRQLNLFDPSTREVTAIATIDEGTPVAMAVSPDAVWILNYEGTLTHVGLG
jgi:WD40-like Beta Propeller Repeat